jgi:hypothetical protein
MRIKCPGLTRGVFKMHGRSEHAVVEYVQGLVKLLFNSIDICVYQ